MSEIKEKMFNGRKIETELLFKSTRETFGAYYEARGWLHAHGYSEGSMAGFGNPIAVMKDIYTLPQKWHNFTAKQKQIPDAVIISSDWREGDVKVLFLEAAKI